MPGASVLGGVCTGHGCFPPRPSTAGSPDFFVNGAASVRVGDPFAVHACGTSSHAGAGAVGSASFFVNGAAQMRIGDDIDCGSASAGGSPDFFVGD